jgi:Arylamine N-acetyltransferase
LNAVLLDRVLDRLGVGRDIECNLDGLRRVYRAWCTSVPFDNTAKLIAIGNRSPGLLPGIDATEFFERFLTHGAGGTCWPTSNALFTLLSAMGFDVRRAAGSMRDTGIVSHGTTKVHIDDIDWLADSSMLTNEPLPLTDEPFIGEDPLVPVEVHKNRGDHIVWWDLPPNESYIPCRLLHDDVSHDFYIERYEASRIRSPFNERIYARRNLGDRMLIITGNRRLLKTTDGVDDSNLSDSELYEILADEIGISTGLLDELRKTPAWDASFIPAPPAAGAASALLQEMPDFSRRSRPSAGSPST